MTKRTISIIAILTACFFSAQGFAVMCQDPYISATSTAELLTDGDHAGMYIYTVDVQWDMRECGEGLNHWDIILKEGCAQDDHIIEFTFPAGNSTSETLPSDPMAIAWSGFFNRNDDLSMDFPTGPVVIYDSPFIPSDAEPGKSGYGRFWFYSNIIPEYGTYEDTIVGRAGNMDDVYGILTGAYPSCTVVPEPATITMLSLGSFLFLLKKKRG